MNIWVDGDACPKPIKEIIFKAAIRTKISAIFVANHFISIPQSPFIKRILVTAGFDVADSEIISQIAAGDLLVTADIPLANEAVMKKAIALNPRGSLYTENNIKQTLAMRDFHSTLRDSGLIQGGASKISATDIRKFANQLDNILNKAK